MAKPKNTLNFVSSRYAYMLTKWFIRATGKLTAMTVNKEIWMNVALIMKQNGTSDIDISFGIIKSV